WGVLSSAEMSLPEMAFPAAAVRTPGSVGLHFDGPTTANRARPVLVVMGFGTSTVCTHPLRSKPGPLTGLETTIAPALRPGRLSWRFGNVGSVLGFGGRPQMSTPCPRWRTRTGRQRPYLFPYRFATRNATNCYQNLLPVSLSQILIPLALRER